MEPVRFIEHEGVQILLIDFTRCRGEEYSRRMELAASIIRSQPENSVLTLTVLAGAEYSPERMMEMRPYVAGNKPYVRAGAVVGLEHLEKLLPPINRMTGRNLRSFEDVESAKAWLVARSRESE